MRRRARKSVSILENGVRRELVLTVRRIVHRPTAALAFLLRLSPFYESQLASLLEVLQSRETLKGKLAKGGCGENGVQKPEVRRLVAEVAEKLCA